ncbi:MAG: integrase arm-type DNA-binding domain-containing protein, partial [Desulfovibrio sp.]|nr:integrase arm-type DNA-binding domain-containing protein [Desulfovibrio sp.]
MTKKLTEKLLKALVQSKLPQTVSDGNNLYFEITKSGTGCWRFRYRYNGKSNRISLGVYPLVSLSDARERCEELRRQLAQHIDPAQAKKEVRQEQKKETALQKITYADVVKEWFAVKQSQNVERTQKVNWQRLERHILPVLGKKPFCTVTMDDQLGIIRALEARDVLEESKRVCDLMEQIGAYAKARQWAKENIADGLKLLIRRRPKIEKKHLPAITDLEGVRGMLKKIDAFCKRGELYGNPSSIMRAALRLYPLTGLRGNELAGLRWEEVFFDEQKAVIPAVRCQKTKKPFTVYLSNQASVILRELHEERRNGFVFRSGGSSGHITLEGVNQALHRSGIPKGQMCNHGWRAVMLTLGHNYCTDYEAVELSASHEIGNAVAQA